MLQHDVTAGERRETPLFRDPRTNREITSVKAAELFRKALTEARYSGDTRRLVRKTVHFLDLTVAFMLTFSYVCQVRDYLKGGSFSLGSIASCSVLFLQNGEEIC